jgi:hypothetical protein
MVEGYCYATHKNPNDVCKNGQTTIIGCTAHHLFAKGSQYQTSQFKTLQTEESAHNGNAQNNAAKNITQRCKKTVEDEPAKVANKIYASIRLKY